MSIAAANRTVEWIREKLDVLRGCCDQCDIGYTCVCILFDFVFSFVGIFE